MSRVTWRHPHWNGKRKEFTIAITMAGCMLILLFLGNMSYLYGSLYHSNYRVHNLKILAVDFDKGVIGQSLSAAYSQLQSNEFPLLDFRTETDFSTAEEVRKAVCKGDYWGGIVVQAGASNRLSAALAGGVAAEGYQSNETITYIYNAARYAAVELGDIVGSMQTLIGATSAAYHALNGTQALGYLNTTSRAAVMAFTEPIQASSITIAPMPQPQRVLYNTVSIVLPIIQQFFFLMALNGINNTFGIYGHLKSSRIGIMRLFISLIYTFLSALTITGYIFAFRQDWPLENAGRTFCLVWMTYWLYAHVNFQILDAVTAFIPMSFISFFVLTWAILNVTSSIYPFELNPGFYRWQYALPGHEVYEILIQVYSGGCVKRLYRALPILFAWEVVGAVVSVAGMGYRNRNARREVLELESKMGNELRGYDEQRNGTARTEELELLKMETSRAAGPSFPMPFLPATGDRRPISGMRRQGTV